MIAIAKVIFTSIKSYLKNHNLDIIEQIILGIIINKLPDLLEYIASILLEMIRTI